MSAFSTEKTENIIYTKDNKAFIPGKKYQVAGKVTPIDYYSFPIFHSQKIILVLSHGHFELKMQMSAFFT